VLGGAQDGPSALYALATDVLAGAGAPMSLRELGLREEDLDRVAEIAAASPYPNPRPVRADALRVLLASAYAGEPPVPDSTR
jgi:alcohol dehydrogenase class IV